MSISSDGVAPPGSFIRASISSNSSTSTDTSGGHTQRYPPRTVTRHIASSGEISRSSAR